MNQAMVDRIVNAVLYEGYILYPYRPSVKNRQRWTFGGLYPPSYSEAQGGADACTMQTECLVRGGANTTLEVKVRFLHLLDRKVGEVISSGERDLEEPAFRLVESLRVGDRLLQPWQEAEEREVSVGDLSPVPLVAQSRWTEIAFPGRRQVEPVRDSSGEIVAVLVREQQVVAGSLEVSAEPVGEGLFKLRVRVENRTHLDNAREMSRDEALLRSLVSTHTILGVRSGAFVSLLDPPNEWRGLAASCRNVGTWPVLVGEAGETDTLLSSPIILYDYPQIAPESPGDLFDGAEIDEILTLRILTLTDDEKQAAAAVDERVRALLHRTETLGREQLMGLHGTIRGLRPVPEESCHE
jgi:hypothetical protein